MFGDIFLVENRRERIEVLVVLPSPFIVFIPVLVFLDAPIVPADGISAQLADVADINQKVIEETAKKNGMLTLEQKGLLMALRGETSLEEISRVI